MTKPYNNDWTEAGRDSRILLEVEEGERREAVKGIRAQLVEFGLAQGYPHAVIRSVVADLYRTFHKEIELFIFAGSDDFSAAVSADVTLAWLETDVAGTTLRQRLLNRID